MTVDHPVYDFDEQLRRADAESRENWVDAWYREHFPNLLSRTPVTSLEHGQKRGRDVALVLSTGDTYRVQEKLRRVYSEDILFEVWHVYSASFRKAGWIQQDLSIDYLAYLWVSARTGVLLPWPQLRSVWAAHGKQWMGAARAGVAGYREVPAQNKGYVTWSIVVPLAHLRAAMAALDGQQELPL